MVANWRVKITMSCCFTGAPNDGRLISRSKPRPFSLIFSGVGLMRWVRRRVMTAWRVIASISPRMVSPFGPTPTHLNTGMTTSPLLLRGTD